MYAHHTREYLGERGVDAELIQRLTAHQPLTADELHRLLQFDHIPTLHLVASNPGLAPHHIRRLAEHDSFEVRTGVALNPNTPLEVLMAMRTPGQYTTVNDTLARNPLLPAELLREMYAAGEIDPVNIAMNPNCPAEIMRDILSSGSDTARTWLATNPNLPEDVMASLAADESVGVHRHVQRNEAYQRWMLQQEP